ncbi:DoxX family protein [Arthrobacter crystallopoietes BAB-32]|uniref:DoxX family protein n=1 Tax=Arthrobacter crystallopoietes BAB-32 TaxID=1246476 RepID=N1V4V8_9MICC|nr:hypothetical protein [Arthrobacter crystallopoietes]EMY35122.1 DoxX family protein [Arthrobacter crystallopoietes BAB-32]
MTVIETGVDTRTSETTARSSARPAALPAAAGKALAVLRILLGTVFLWAFLDKALGLGFATPANKSWLAGGEPTSGYLGSLEGAFAGAFQPLAGQAWVDWSFMLGMLAVGSALILGIGLRAAAVGGTLIMGLMWLSSLPLKNHPVVDEHAIYASALWLLALAGAGQVWGLGKAWSRLPIVQRIGWLR